MKRQGIRGIHERLGIKAYVAGFGSVWTTYFMEREPLNYTDLMENDSNCTNVPAEIDGERHFQNADELEAQSHRLQPYGSGYRLYAAMHEDVLKQM